MKKQITEEMGVHKEWYKENPKNLEDLFKFLKHLQDDYGHDYGTICHALTAGAIATMRTLDNGSQGGITGFQAGCIMWEFISRWMHYEEQPLRLVKYEEMLYPQYEHQFSKTITKNTWDYLQKKAAERLKENEAAHPNVVAHWRSIVDGKIPFGYVIGSDK